MTIMSHMKFNLKNLLTKSVIITIIEPIYYSKDIYTRGFSRTKRVITNNILIMLDLDINKVKQLPFKEIMELINANNGFFYNENSKKKLNRYAGEVPRRTFYRSSGKSTRGSKDSRLFRA